MNALYNRSGEVIAYLHQNAIMHPDTFEVIGMTLGNCVFDPQAKVIGKFFHDKVYAISGELLAKKDHKPVSIPQYLNVTDSIMQSWQILTRIKDHVCPWVTEKETWSNRSLAEYLYVCP